jgi:hypothetical protein
MASADLLCSASVVAGLFSLYTHTILVSWGFSQYMSLLIRIHWGVRYSPGGFVSGLTGLREI